MMSEENLSRMHVQLSGRVQGVGFRYFVVQESEKLKVTGWVRNRWNGTLEVVAEGTRSDLDRFLAALRRGPRAAHVTQVDVDWQEASAEFTQFSIRRTG